MHELDLKNYMGNSVNKFSKKGIFLSRCKKYADLIIGITSVYAGGFKKISGIMNLINTLMEVNYTSITL